MRFSLFGGVFNLITSGDHEADSERLKTVNFEGQIQTRNAGGMKSDYWPTRTWVGGNHPWHISYLFRCVFVERL